MGYLANFMVYTLAMVGVIVVALLIFKSATSGGITGGKSKYLKIIDTLNLAPRKTLYIVSTGREKFLIAGDVDKTSLISKLETGEDTEHVNISGVNSIEEYSSENLSYHNNRHLTPTLSWIIRGGGRVTSDRHLTGLRPTENPLSSKERESLDLNSAPLTFQETMSKLPKPSFMDKSDIGIKSSILNPNSPHKRSVMRNLAEKMK